MYIRAANETAEAQLTPSTMAHSLGAIDALLKQVHLSRATA